jgi:hypothetical protein
MKKGKKQEEPIEPIQEVKLSEDEFNNLLETVTECACVTSGLPAGIKIEIESERKTGDLLIHIDGLESEQAELLTKKFDNWINYLMEELKREEKEEEEENEVG